MKKIIKYILTAILIVSLGNCTDNFEALNTDPSQITEESLRQNFNLVGGSFTPMFLNVFNATPAWNYQLQQGLMGDVYSGYMTPPTPFAGNVNNMTYALVDGWNTFPWDDAYTSVMPSVIDIKKEVVLNGGDPLKKFEDIANIIKVAAMHRVSDIYGPIRYTKFEVQATTGEYDSQETAYNAFFTDLENAIDNLEGRVTEPQFKPFDLSSLEGDVAGWRKFANSL